MSPTFNSPYDPSRRYGRAERVGLTQELLTEAADRRSEAERDELLDAVVLLNRCVADSIARRYRGRGIADEDLSQVAYEGLVKAVQRFNPGPHDFLSFAVPTITGEVRRHFRDQGWMVRPPRRVQELQFRINGLTSDLHQQLGREPNRLDLIAALNVTASEYDEAVLAYGSFCPTSLDAPSDAATEWTPADSLAGEDRDFSRSEARLVVTPLVAELSEPDRQLLNMRFVHGLSQAEIGQRLGVTQMQISRRLARVLVALRSAMGGYQPASSFHPPTRAAAGWESRPAGATA